MGLYIYVLSSISINYLQFRLSILFMLSPILETLLAALWVVLFAKQYNPFKYYLIVTFKWKTPVSLCSNTLFKHLHAHSSILGTLHTLHKSTSQSCLSWSQSLRSLVFLTNMIIDKDVYRLYIWDKLYESSNDQKLAWD